MNSFCPCEKILGFFRILVTYSYQKNKAFYVIFSLLLIAIIVTVYTGYNFIIIIASLLTSILAVLFTNMVNTFQREKSALCCAIYELNERKRDLEKLKEGLEKQHNNNRNDFMRKTGGREGEQQQSVLEFLDGFFFSEYHQVFEIALDSEKQLQFLIREGENEKIINDALTSKAGAESIWYRVNQRNYHFKNIADRMYHFIDGYIQDNIDIEESLEEIENAYHYNCINGVSEKLIPDIDECIQIIQGVISNCDNLLKYQYSYNRA